MHENWLGEALAWIIGIWYWINKGKNKDEKMLAQYGSLSLACKVQCLITRLAFALMYFFLRVIDEKPTRFH